MKTKSFLMMLCVSMLIGFATVSCDKNEDVIKSEERTEENACVGGDSEVDQLPNPIILKFDGKYNYLQYVTVTYDFIEEKIKAYPSAEVEPLNLIELKNGYYYANCDYFSEQAYTDVTFEEYKQMCKEDKNLSATLQNRIISTEYLLEEYHVADINDFMKEGNLNVDLLDSLIVSGEFFTHEGVTRIK